MLCGRKIHSAHRGNKFSFQMFILIIINCVSNEDRKTGNGRTEYSICDVYLFWIITIATFLVLLRK